MPEHIKLMIKQTIPMVVVARTDKLVLLLLGICSLFRMYARDSKGLGWCACMVSTLWPGLH